MWSETIVDFGSPDVFKAVKKNAKYRLVEMPWKVDDSKSFYEYVFENLVACNGDEIFLSASLSGFYKANIALAESDRLTLIGEMGPIKGIETYDVGEGIIGILKNDRASQITGDLAVKEELFWLLKELSKLDDEPLKMLYEGICYFLMDDYVKTRTILNKGINDSIFKLEFKKIAKFALKQIPAKKNKLRSENSIVLLTSRKMSDLGGERFQLKLIEKSINRILDSNWMLWRFNVLKYESLSAIIHKNKFIKNVRMIVFVGHADVLKGSFILNLAEGEMRRPLEAKGLIALGQQMKNSKQNAVMVFSCKGELYLDNVLNTRYPYIYSHSTSNHAEEEVYLERFVAGLVQGKSAAAAHSLGLFALRFRSRHALDCRYAKL